MTDNKANSEGQEEHRSTHSVRLPGFLMPEDDDIGLGDVVKRFTTVIGVKPCGGCQQRAAALNNWMTFTGWRSR